MWIRLRLFYGTLCLIYCTFFTANLSARWTEKMIDDAVEYFNYIISNVNILNEFKFDYILGYESARAVYVHSYVHGVHLSVDSVLNGVYHLFRLLKFK